MLRESKPFGVDSGHAVRQGGTNRWFADQTNPTNIPITSDGNDRINELEVNDATPHDHTRCAEKSLGDGFSSPLVQLYDCRVKRRQPGRYPNCLTKTL